MPNFFFFLKISTFGRFFRVTTFGESHCAGVGCIVDGVPPRMTLSESDIQPQLDRRRPGQSSLATPRDEKDKVKILSGTEMGVSLGTPIALMIPNEDQRKGDYAETDDVPRPSHADYTYQAKYGVRASSGGGRSSARETAARVAAGAIAERMLKHAHGIEIVAWVSGVGTVQTRAVDPLTVTRAAVDGNLVRCPDAEAAAAMQREIEAARDAKDSVGGIVDFVCRGVPAGWGEPCFDKLEALLAHAMLSIPATKGFEIGSGFAGTAMRGSAHNDLFVARPDGTLATATNHSGGVQGGISNGEYIHCRIAFKPPATIGQAQETVTYDGAKAILEAKGRHDPCVVTRAVAIVEAMAALVLADAALAQYARTASAAVPFPDFETPINQKKRKAGK